MKIQIGDTVELKLSSCGEWYEYHVLAAFKVPKTGKLHAVICMCGDVKPRFIAWSDMIKAAEGRRK